MMILLNTHIYTQIGITIYKLPYNHINTYFFIDISAIFIYHNKIIKNRKIIFKLFLFIQIALAILYLLSIARFSNE